MASAMIQPGNTTNTTAVITDSESLSGTGLNFTLDSTSGAPVLCNGSGTPADPMVCTTGAQVGDSSVTFNKIVSVDQPRITSGTLSDTAVLNGSDGFTTNASASIAIMSTATVSLTINKTIPDILQNSDTLTCDFAITGPNSFSDTAAIVFTAGNTSDSAVLTGLEPGSYTVTETDCDGLTPANGVNEQTVDIVLPTCAESVSFVNDIPPVERAKARVQKVTLPSGSEAGWEFTLSGPGGPIQLTTTGAGYEFFLDPDDSVFELLEGDYTITEVAKPGWDQTMASAGCSFSVDYPADFGKTFSCTIENTQRGMIIVEKQTDPDGAAGSFLFSGALVGSISDDGTIPSGLLEPGSYEVTEEGPGPNFDLIDITCDDAGSVTPSFGDVPTGKATFKLDPGETVTCVFTNRQRGMVELTKLTNGLESPTANWNFSLVGSGVNLVDSTPPTLVDFGGAKLIPGEVYTLCETGIPAGWTQEWMVDTDGDGVPDTIIPMVAGVNSDPVGPDGYSRIYDPNYVAPPAEYTNDTRCVDFVVEAAEVLAFQLDNSHPGGDPRTIGYWKNWNTCSGGNQVETAAGNGGPDEGWFILDDLLNDPGFTLGTLLLDADDCEAAVSILDKRDVSSGRKRASDGAYNLASQLLAAMLNLSAGAETCQAAVDAVNDGQDLLSTIGFDGDGRFLRPKDGSYSEATTLAGQLDLYNNGDLCTP